MAKEWFLGPASNINVRESFGEKKNGKINNDFFNASPEAILAKKKNFLNILFSIIHIKDLNFEPAGLLKIVLIVTPLFKG